VLYYDCSQVDYNVRVVTIDRNLENAELWTLSLPNPNHVIPPPPVPTPGPPPPSELGPPILPADDQSLLLLRNTRTLAGAYNAVVAINGYTWQGSWGASEAGHGTPTTSMYATNMHLTYNTTFCDADASYDSESCHPDIRPCCKEVQMGFAPNQSGFLDVRRIAATDELQTAPASPYRYNLYGSNTTVMSLDGGCMDAGIFDSDHYSMLGYSGTQVIFLITDTESEPSELCGVLSNFGATEVVMQDSGHSTQMFMQLANGQSPTTFLDPSEADRGVAYAIGLVNLYSMNLANAGFEELRLQDRQPVRVDNTSNSELEPGWKGHYMLHAIEATASTGSTQAAELRLTGAVDHITQQFQAPPETFCALHFRRGKNPADGCEETRLEIALQTTGSDGTLTTVEDYIVYLDLDPVAADGSPMLIEDWVRFHTMTANSTLMFGALTPGCGVFLDDVSIRCTKPLDP